MSYIVERLLSTTEPGQCDWCKRPSDEALGEIKPWDGVESIHPGVRLHDGCIEPFSDFLAGLRFVTDRRDYEPVTEAAASIAWRWRTRCQSEQREQPGTATPFGGDESHDS